MYGSNVQHEYKGYKYDQCATQEDEEVIKNYHDVTTPTGEVIHMDWSSYGTPNLEEFQMWVDLGMPNRNHPAIKSCGPMRRDDLLKVFNYKQGA